MGVSDLFASVEIGTNLTRFLFFDRLPDLWGCTINQIANCPLYSTFKIRLWIYTHKSLSIQSGSIQFLMVLKSVKFLFRAQIYLEWLFYQVMVVFGQLKVIIKRNYICSLLWCHFSLKHTNSHFICCASILLRSSNNIYMDCQR